MDLQLEYRPGSATPPPSGLYTKYRAIFVVCKPGSNSELLSIQDSKTCTPSRLKTWLLIGGVSIKDKRASHAIPCSGINITEHTPYFVTRKENKAKKQFYQIIPFPSAQPPTASPYSLRAPPRWPHPPAATWPWTQCARWSAHPGKRG